MSRRYDWLPVQRQYHLFADLGRRLRRSGRRHAALLQHVNDAVPDFAVLDQRTLADQRRQVEASRLGERPVAGLAIFCNEWGDGVRGRLPRQLRLRQRRPE